MFNLSSSQLCEKISKWSIYLLVFLLPIFFLPWSGNVLDFNKQALLIFLVFVALFCWLLKFLIEGKFEFSQNLINLPVLALILVLGVGTFLSLSRYGSFWGWPLSTGESFLSWLGLGILFFLITQIFSKKEEVLFLLLILLFSGFLVTLFGGLQLFSKFLLPLNFAKISSFNTIGTVNALSVFIGALLPILICLLLLISGWPRVVLGLFGLSFLFLLLIINFWVAWVVVLVGTALIWIFGVVLGKSGSFDPRYQILPMIILALATLLIFIRFPFPGAPPVPLEVSPSYQANLEIGIETIKEKPLFGFGPGTFAFAYSKFKDQTLNQTAFWNIRFGSGASKILDGLSTTGALGTLALLGLIATFGWFAFRRLRFFEKEEISFLWILLLGVFAGFGATVAGFFLYPSNLSLNFLFWLTLACFIALSPESKRSWRLEPSSLPMMGVSFALVLIIIFGIGLFYLEGQRYAGEISYLSGVNAFTRNDFRAAENSLLKAISHNRYQDTYWRDLSQVYLFRIREELARQGLPQEIVAQNVNLLMANAINAAKVATDLEPANVANWSVRGFVYRNLIGLIGGAEEWSIKAYQRAQELEPVNPYLPTEIGRTYLAWGNLLRQQQNITQAQEKYDQALKEFEKALELKGDYAPAHFNIALIYDLQGKRRQAIAKMEEAKQAAPFDVGLAFQLGLLYYRDNRFLDAQREFERAVIFDPNYSNARYFLGLIYDRQGRKDLAISQFERIEALNPENQEVKQILKNLRAGRPALEGIVAPTEEVPIEEKQPERKR